jgi:hypothetical protein
MTDEIIERVSRAIAESEGANWPLSDSMHSEYLIIARAAIEAMRGPTPEMLPEEMYEKTYRHIWQKMISAALGEKP